MADSQRIHKAHKERSIGEFSIKRCLLRLARKKLTRNCLRQFGNCSESTQHRHPQRTVIPAYRQAGRAHCETVRKQRALSVGEESATLMRQLNYEIFRESVL